LPIPLVERSDKEIARAIKKRVETIGDVKDCHLVTVRITGKRCDVDLHVSLDINLRFEEVHRIASRIEREVRCILPKARVTVQTDPQGHRREDIRTLVKEIADKVPGSRGVHNVHVQRINGNLSLDFHLEVSANMTVKHANEISSEIEQKLRAANPNIAEVTIHMESASDLISRELQGGGTEVKWYIEHAAKRFPEIRRVHGIRIRRIGDRFHVVLRCRFDPNLSMKQAHETSTNLEAAIKSAYPAIDRVDVHEESA
jgi:divalent metal cation (Fe/Co/Zn/Cd) transporter